METLKFKTTIKCGGCIATVTPALDELEGVEKWEVNTADPDKILTIQAADGLQAEEVTKALENKGYRAELI